MINAPGQEIIENRKLEIQAFEETGRPRAESS